MLLKLLCKVNDQNTIKKGPSSLMFWYSMIQLIKGISGTLKVEKGNSHIQCKKINIYFDVANDLEVWYALLTKRISLRRHIVQLAFDKTSGDPKSRNNYLQHGFPLISVLRTAWFYKLINNMSFNVLLQAVSFLLYPKQLGLEEGGGCTLPLKSPVPHTIKSWNLHQTQSFTKNYDRKRY